MAEGITHSLGHLLVHIGAELSELKEGVHEAETTLERLGNATKWAAAIATAAAAAGAALVEHLVRHSLESIEAQDKLAYRLDASTGALQVLQAAAALTGQSTDELNGGLAKLNVHLAEVSRTGKGGAADALKNLKLNADELLKLDIDTRMLKIAEAFEKGGYSASQQSDALKQLGLRTQGMVLLFEDGGAAIKEASNLLEAFGGKISKVDSRMVKEAMDEFNKLGIAIKAVSDGLAVALAPVLKEIANHFVEMAEHAGGLDELTKKLVENMFRGFGYVQLAIYNVRMVLGDLTADLKMVAAVNGAAIAIMTGNVKGFLENMKKLSSTWAGVKVELGEAPDPEKMVDYYNSLVLKAKLTALTLKDINKTIYGPEKKANVDPLSGEERDALNKKLLDLRASIATEDKALEAQADKQLLELKQLESKKGFVIADANELRKRIDEKYEKDKQDLIFTKLEQGAATELEIMKRNQEEQLKTIQTFEDNKTITTEKAEELRKKYIAKNALDILQLQARQYTGLAEIVDTSMSQISQIVGKEGGTAFNVMKAISMATALVKGYEAVVSAFAAGNKIGGPPVGFAFAAIAAAGVAAQIAALAAVRPGSGAAAPAASTGGGDTSAAAASAGGDGGASSAGNGQTLYIKGLDRKSFFSGDAVRELVQELHQFQRDGGKLVVA